MSDNDAAVLISRFLADDLDQAERDRLAEAVHADPALRAEVLSQQRLAVLIHAATVPRDDPRVVAGVLNAMRVSRAFRVVRGVRSRQTRQQRRIWVVWAAAAAVLVVTAMGWYLLDGAVPPREAPSQVPVAATRTAGAAGEQMVLDDGTQLAIAAQSRYAWETASRVLRLDDGRLSAQVVKQDPARPLRFVTAEGVATVVGTRFRFARDAAGTRLDVDEGTVRLEGSARTCLVEAMHGTAIRRGGTGPEAVGLVAGVRPDGRRLDVAGGGLDAWHVRTWNDQARIELDRSAPGMLGIRSTDAAQGWAGRIIDPVQDWSGSRGLAVRMRVEGRAEVRFELSDAGFTKDGKVNIEHWEKIIVVPADAWRRIEIPFRELQVNKAEGGNNGLFDPAHVWSMGLHITGVGRVDIDTIELIP